jgi:hypothetical protein
MQGAAASGQVTVGNKQESRRSGPSRPRQQRCVATCSPSWRPSRAAAWLFGGAQLRGLREEHRSVCLQVPDPAQPFQHYSLVGAAQHSAHRRVHFVLTALCLGSAAEVLGHTAKRRFEKDAMKLSKVHGMRGAHTTNAQQMKWSSIREEVCHACSCLHMRDRTIMRHRRRKPSAARNKERRPRLSRAAVGMKGHQAHHTRFVRLRHAPPRAPACQPCGGRNAVKDARHGRSALQDRCEEEMQKCEVCW